MMPMGFEYGWSRRLDVVGTRDDEPEPKRFDLSEFIAEVNAMKKSIPALNEEGPQRLLSNQDDPLVVLERRTESGDERAFILVNTHEHEPRVETLDDRDRRASDRRPASDVGAVTVAPLDVRVLRAARPPERPVAAASAVAAREARIHIEEVYPELDGGRYPVKRIVGELFEVWADMFRDGHDKLRAVAQIPAARTRSGAKRRSSFTTTIAGSAASGSMRSASGGTRSRPGPTISRAGATRSKRSARPARTSSSNSSRGGRSSRPRCSRRDAGDAGRHPRACCAISSSGDSAGRAELLLSPEFATLMARCSVRSDAVRYPRELEVVVDRKAARFAAWYEMFPRSQGSEPGKGATFDDCIARLPEIARLGFDVVYLVPIHPIGRVNRKGKDNSTVAEPGDPGSPYAIGSAEGGHRAVNPELGTLADFRRFVRAAAALGMEVALDFAIQAAPDHPWVREHPEWFRFRPDGTIKYAENPPKKYEDIVNVDFDNPDREGLWAELRDTILFWIGEGVRTFRVDNPHTKPLPFWEWLIREVKARCPEAIFLSEAFTRPKMMRALAKAGFTQSYTYFTWRNTKSELTEYLTELTPIRRRNISDRTSSPTRRTFCRSSCRKAAGRLSHSPGAGRDLVAGLRHL